MNKPPADLDNWIKENLFDSIPMAIAVIDQQYDLVYANRAFEEMFGTWQNRKCYKVYKGREDKCLQCKGSAAFSDGVARVNEEVGYNKNGRLTRYIKHTLPVKDADGKVPFLVEISTDITETEQIRREHQLLFDQVPCNIAILDRDLRIVKTNKRLRETFGELEGELCYKAFKGMDAECYDCPAQLSFEDGQMHTAHSAVADKTGRQVDLFVTTVPLEQDTGEVEFVMEMAVDITETLQLQDELKVAYSVMEAMIAESMDGIITTDDLGEVNIFNPAARHIFKVKKDRRVTKGELLAMLPEGFVEEVARDRGHVYLQDTVVTDLEGEQIPARLVGITLKMGNRFMGMALSIQDTRRLKTLEREKLEAERLAAVGQTVAGLAHGVKNLITGLEGGLYMLNSGLKKSDAARLAQGLEMLNRNIERIAVFVKEFLTFSKGRVIRAKVCDPAEIADEVVRLYSPKAQEEGIRLVSDMPGKVEPASLDYESMHECLTNLVGNAIDACRASDDPTQCMVRVRTLDSEGELVFEVSDDGCGMDYEVKKKVFTNFFTTKGSGGTGLGLLTTKKIVTEHGGRIQVESEAGKGSTFRIILPRNRLPQPEPGGGEGTEPI